MKLKQLRKRHPWTFALTGLALIGLWLWLSMGHLEPANGAERSSAPATEASVQTGWPGCRGGYCSSFNAPPAEDLYQDPRAGTVMLRCGGVTAIGGIFGGAAGASGAGGTCLYLTLW